MKVMNKKKLQKLRLPKLTPEKPFRIRSACKQRFNKQSSLDQNIHTIQIQKKNATIQLSAEKHRSYSSKPSTSWKVNYRKQETISSDEEYNQNYKLRMSSKSRASLQKQHKQNMIQLKNITKLFDPKRIMKIQKRKQQTIDEQSRKQRNKVYKCQFRANQYIFQGKKSKTKSKAKQKIDDQADQYWKKVNQSMILASYKNQEQISKDLRQIMQNFVKQ